MSTSNKGNVVWTLEEDECLIDFVKNHAALYNVKCKDYRKTQMKLNLWKEIANILENKTDTECSKRWGYVRDYYIRRKEKPGTGTTGEAARKRAEQLSFLDSYSSTKRSTNMGTSDQNAPKVNNVVEEGFTDELENSMQETLDSQSPKHTGHSEKRLKFPKEIAEKRNNEEQDEVDLFFGSIAKIFKKLPETEQVYLRLQIDTMVGHAQLRCLQQQDCNRTISTSSSGANYNPSNEASSSTSNNLQSVVPKLEPSSTPASIHLSPFSTGDTNDFF